MRGTIVDKGFKYMIAGLCLAMIVLSSVHFWPKSGYPTSDVARIETIHSHSSSKGLAGMALVDDHTHSHAASRTSQAAIVTRSLPRTRHVDSVVVADFIALLERPPRLTPIADVLT